MCACSLSTPLFSALCFGEHNCTQAGCFILFICLVNVPVVFFCGNAEHFIVCNSRKWNVLKEIEMWNPATFCEQKAFLSIVGLKSCWFAQEKSWLVFVVMNKKVGWALCCQKNVYRGFLDGLVAPWLIGSEFVVNQFLCCLKKYKITVCSYSFTLQFIFSSFVSCHIRIDLCISAFYRYNFLSSVIHAF